MESPKLDEFGKSGSDLRSKLVSTHGIVCNLFIYVSRNNFNVKVSMYDLLFLGFG
jgi:hypothetical protein